LTAQPNDQEPCRDEEEGGSKEQDRPSVTIGRGAGTQVNRTNQRRLLLANDSRHFSAYPGGQMCG
jgi:hypothetical protein